MSDIIFSPMLLINTSKQLYNLLSINVLIDDLQHSIKSIYSNISTAHYNAARNVIDNAHRSNNPRHEVQIAIGHLQMAFQITFDLTTATQRSHFCFIPFKVGLLDNDEISYILSYSAHYAAIISWLYHSISEEKLAITWSDRAIEIFKDAVEQKIYTYKELKKINPKYVKVALVSDKSPSAVHPVSFGFERQITFLGRIYIKDQKQEMINNFVIAISNKKITISCEANSLI